MRLSYSGLNTFKQCERKFYYKYIAKLEPTNVYNDKYARFGSCVHKIIEEFDEDIEDELINKYYFNYNLSDEFCKSEIKKCIENFKNKNYNIISNEEMLHVEFNGFKFIGYIDAILDDYTIVDWKTSKYSKQKEEQYIEQAKFYAWLYYKKYNILVPKVIIYFIKDDIEVEKMITIDDIKEMETKIIDLVNKIKSKVKFSDFKSNSILDYACKFCEYKNKCFEDDYNQKKEIVITVELKNNKLIINAPKKLQELIDRYFTKKLSYVMDNAYYISKALKRKGIDFDGIVKLYVDGETYLGFKDYVIDILRNKVAKNLENKGYKTTVKIVDSRDYPTINAGITTKKLNGIELRDYQKEAVAFAINKEICLLEIATGGGKTAIASEIIRQLNYKTLFVVNTLDLLEQSKKSLEKYLGIEVGTISEGKQNWKGVNVATIQTITNLIKNKDKEFLRNLNEVNVIIVDECHLSKAKSYNMLLKKCRAKYRIGLSATPFSNGNDSLELYKNFGFPEFKLSLKDLIKLGYLVEPEIYFVKYKHIGYYEDYQEAYDNILLSEERLNKLKAIVEKHKNDYVLIITRRLSHAEKIKEILGGDIEIINGKMNKEKRKQIFEDFKNGKRKILIGTDKIVSTGLDIPILNVIINYSANLSKIQTIQSLGRLTRKHSNKTKAYYYDFYDDNDYLIKATNTRIKTFKELGFEPKIIE